MYLECGFDGVFENPCDVLNNVTWQNSPDGMCHTFNSRATIDRQGQKISTRGGGNYGLKLTINVEQYDYFQGISDAAGIQVKEIKNGVQYGCLDVG